MTLHKFPLVSKKVCIVSFIPESVISVFSLAKKFTHDRVLSNESLHVKSSIIKSNEGLIAKIKLKGIITFQNKSINIC